MERKGCIRVINDPFMGKRIQTVVSTKIYHREADKKISQML